MVQFVECKNCGVTEEHPEDQSREKMQCFKLVKYVNCKRGVYECLDCGTLNKARINNYDHLEAAHIDD